MVGTSDKRLDSDLLVVFQLIPGRVFLCLLLHLNLEEEVVPGLDISLAQFRCILSEGRVLVVFSDLACHTYEPRKAPCLYLLVPASSPLTHFVGWIESWRV